MNVTIPLLVRSINHFMEPKETSLNLDNFSIREVLRLHDLGIKRLTYDSLRYNGQTRYYFLYSNCNDDNNYPLTFRSGPIMLNNNFSIEFIHNSYARLGIPLEADDPHQQELKY